LIDWLKIVHLAEAQYGLESRYEGVTGVCDGNCWGCVWQHPCSAQALVHRLPPGVRTSGHSLRSENAKALRP